MDWIFKRFKISELIAVHSPFSSGALLYFSNLLTAMASNLTLAAGYSFRTSHISFLLKTNRSLYPTDLTLAVLRFPKRKLNSNNKVPDTMKAHSVVEKYSDNVIFEKCIIWGDYKSHINWKVWIAGSYFWNFGRHYSKSFDSCEACFMLHKIIMWTADSFSRRSTKQSSAEKILHVQDKKRFSLQPYYRLKTRPLLKWFAFTHK